MHCISDEMVSVLECRKMVGSSPGGVKQIKD
jgi:hypothetical protein